MTVIKWNSFGERFYETGIDKAVLYVDGQSPVSWNGLMSVSHSPTSGESNALYRDGVKFFDNISRQEFKAVITAIYTPYEFNYCNGVLPIEAMGLLATNQTRSSFNLCYRTMIGNDIDGLNTGYKIHLIYNASTVSSNRDYTSLSNSTNPTPISWTITAVPPLFNGYNATAYRIIDTRKYSSSIIAQLEDILYGTDTTLPRFPFSDELTYLLGG